VAEDARPSGQSEKDKPVDEADGAGGDLSEAAVVGTRA